MGTPITNLGQSNNTFSANESFSKVVRNHTLKAGVREFRAGERPSRRDIEWHLPI